MKQVIKLTAILIALSYALYAFSGCGILSLFVGDESESESAYESESETESAYESEDDTESAIEEDSSDTSESESITEETEFSLTREALANYVIVVPNGSAEDMELVMERFEVVLAEYYLDFLSKK